MDDIPTFLRLTAEERAAAWVAHPPAPPQQKVLTSVKRGRYPPHWLDDPGTRELIEAERRKLMGQWLSGQRYQVYWRQAAGDKLRFVGYHDSSRTDADWSEEFNAYIVEGGTAPAVDWPIDGADFSTMPAVRELDSGRKMTRAAKRAQKKALTVKPISGPTETHVKILSTPKKSRAAEVAEEANQPPARGGGGRAKALAALPQGGRIKVVGAHGRKPGTGKHARAELVVKHDGKTLEEFLAGGGNPETLHNGAKEGWVRLT